MQFKTVVFLTALAGLATACTPGEYACSNPQPDGRWIGLAECDSNGKVIQFGTCQAGTHCENVGTGVVCVAN